MKSILIIASFLFIGITYSYGQHKELVITNKSTCQEIVIPEGKAITVLYHNGKSYFGELVLTDTLYLMTANEIMVGRVKMDINNIIEIKPFSGVRYLLGGTLIVCGSVLFIHGIVKFVYAVNNNKMPHSDNYEQQEYYNNNQFSYMLNHLVNYANGIYGIGFGIITISCGVTIISNCKKYKSENWEYSIRQE